ncbi:MAG TPA: glycosyltransferase, partial [Burkholderiaceae bacterium]|nr:glycosyltransferase [Burkholderiaceae bacterium]
MTDDIARNMKILLTTPVFLPDFFGGTETLVHGIAMDLTQRGHSVTIVTGYPDNESFEADDCFDEYTYDSIRVMRFKYHTKSVGRQINRMRNDYGNLVFEVGFRKLLEESRPDIVHFHHFGRLSIKAIDACVERRIPTFLTVTDFWSICPQQSLLLPNGKMCDGPRMG